MMFARRRQLQPRSRGLNQVTRNTRLGVEMPVVLGMFVCRCTFFVIVVTPSITKESHSQS